MGCVFVCFASEMVAGKRKVKGRGLTGAADLRNAATGKIKKETQYIGLAWDYIQKLRFCRGRKQRSKSKASIYFPIMTQTQPKLESQSEVPLLHGKSITKARFYGNDIWSGAKSRLI